jgi:hypothetical protein
LKERFRYPESAATDLIHVAQYAALAQGSAWLQAALHQILSVDYPPTSVHQALASLTGGLGQISERRLRYPLLVTTNYDDLLERAFVESNQPFDLVYVEATGRGRGKFWHRPPNDSPRLIERPNTYRGLSLDQRPVILKAYGSIDRTDTTAERDSYVITEDDFIDYLPHPDFSTFCPVPLPEKLKRSHHLFLGYHIADWSHRVILRRIWSSQEGDLEPWVVQEQLSPVEETYWNARKAKIIRASLSDFVLGLSEMARNSPGSRGGS